VLESNPTMTILNHSALRHVGAPLVFLATCWLLCARPASAQQPVMVKQAAATKQPLAPLPPPELIAPPLPRPGLALADLEHIALSSNPSIARAGALVGAAQGNLVQVGLLPNPTAGYSGQQVGSGGLAEQHGIQFSQEVVRGGKLRLNRAAAEQELSRAQQELAMQQQRVLTDVRIAYSKTLLAQRQIDLTANLVQASTQGASIVDTLIRAKEAIRLDVLQPQIEVENSQILAKIARNGHDTAWRELSSVVGDANHHPNRSPVTLLHRRARLTSSKRYNGCKTLAPKLPSP
jgi:outer membrane protein, heavy metal efflux system